MAFNYSEEIGQLPDADRLHFYEVLAHNLTVGIRSVWSDPGLSDAEKVERIKWINEVLHSATAKVWVLRLKTHEWTEADFWDMIRHYGDLNPGIRGELAVAVNRSYEAVTGKQIG